jgi:hypothetical protein
MLLRSSQIANITETRRTCRTALRCQTAASIRRGTYTTAAQRQRQHHQNQRPQTRSKTKQKRSWKLGRTASDRRRSRTCRCCRSPTCCHRGSDTTEGCKGLSESHVGARRTLQPRLVLLLSTWQALVSQSRQQERPRCNSTCSRKRHEEGYLVISLGRAQLKAWFYRSAFSGDVRTEVVSVTVDRTGSRQIERVGLRSSRISRRTLQKVCHRAVESRKKRCGSGAENDLRQPQLVLHLDPR